MNKSATYKQIEKILRLTSRYKDRDYLSNVLNYFHVDSKFKLTEKQADKAVELIRKWRRENVARRKKKSNKFDTARVKQQNYLQWKKDYEKYLQSDHWKETKLRLRKDGCFICPEKKNLHLHHRNYRNLGRETNRDVVTLCADCHLKVHKLARNKKNILDINTAVEYLKGKK